MPGTTAREAFDGLLDGRRVVPVVRELFADSETPLGIFRKLALRADGRTRPGAFLLESAEQGGIWSRYSFVGVAAFGALTEQRGRPVWQDWGVPASRVFPAGGITGDYLEALDDLHSHWASPPVDGLPPLTGGLVGYIGWDAVRLLERLPDAPPADYPVPELGMVFASEVVAVDHLKGTVSLLVTVLNDGRDAAEALWADAQRRLDALERRLGAPVEAQLAEVDLGIVPEPELRTAREDYLAAVERAKEHIRDGDVFQVVIAQRFDLPTAASPLDVYRVLRQLNPSPYMYLLAHERPDGTPFAVVGSSPEALVKVEDGRVFSHPIAGSRPRGATPEADEAFAAELRVDEKERAEHLMLVDLARNDLAKVCVPGTVDVTEFMRIERFSHIMHITSSVEGELAAGTGPVDVLRATFPAGTLSGAPKPRALEIIDALEPARRGVYGGVVGYFDFAGDLDLAIAIRTAYLSEGVARVQAGGGLVADSVPESEYAESRNKAMAPLKAVAVASAMRAVGTR
ncbi:anthranilate synthase component I [Amnibacterium sp. CER49]|uniref:anthranilate synthase component I n=1 Tax=Amnibacterium sp. CER49 TaxID=3039161 RepID=UPI00244B7CC5|nr:anthranilate synthase component I [Amnibacterium sp. CER49]MDH2444351.1 anthranilate synthase component I [Amnibacterium sp. CER49]